MNDSLKTERQRLIREIVTENKFERQEQIAECLRSQGYLVTQSSVSRDLTELRVFKLEGRYTLSASQIFGVLAAHAAGHHLLVIKTEPGAAPHVALKLDQMRGYDIIGTVAGDDTLFVATHNQAGQIEIAAQLGLKVT